MNQEITKREEDNGNAGASGKRGTRAVIVSAAVIVLCLWLGSGIFIVQETETAVATRFSRPLARVYEPGLHVKLPFPFDAVIRFDSRLIVFDHEPTEFLTLDKKNILIDTYALWKIEDEFKFLSTLRNRDRAEARLLDMITSVIGEVVGTYPLKHFINTDENEVKLEEIDERILDPCRTSARNNFGIDIMDLRVNAFNFPDQNRQSVIKRMQAERNRIAPQYRSEGNEEALKIEAATDYEVRRILAEANREAQVIRGDAEAEAIRIYGEAYEADPAFYEFIRTLDAYRKIVDSNTTFVMRSDSILWKLMDRGKP